MSFIAERIPYSETGSFSKIVLDYLGDAAALKPFYQFSPDIEGIKKAVAERKNFPVNRPLLSDVLQKQYKGIDTSPKLKANLAALLSEDSFTVCTAHQPNIFTGHLYFIYKILHAIKLSDELNEQMPGKKFIPVYYMGSEDADLQELGEVNIHGNKYEWKTAQSGAVGRMKIDKSFMRIKEEIEGRLAVDEYGPAVLKALQDAYRADRTIEEATFRFVHALFNDFGLVVLLPDNRELKNAFIPVMKKELQEQFSHAALSSTVAAFPKEYKVQAAGRDINLFYLDEHSRERIEKTGNGFSVANTAIRFSKEELDQVLMNEPEKFSPNVILRPLFQELILPDVAFIGGGGELAYWLELKNVFEVANVFFPVLLLRNSFTLINKDVSANITKLSLNTAGLFKPEQELLTGLVKKDSQLKLDLDEEKQRLSTLYEMIKIQAAAVDATLSRHVEALCVQALHRLESLEKKMLKAERKKFEAEQRQLSKIKNALFSGGILQERSGNILEWLAGCGKDILDILYKNSQAIPTTFTVLTEQ